MAGLETLALASGLANAGGGGGGGATTDQYGLGRIVDEASEVLDSLDRPILNSVSVTHGKKKGDYTRTEIHISKLDTILLSIIGVIFYVGVKKHVNLGGNAGSTWVLEKLQPFQTKLLASVAPSGWTPGSSVYNLFGGQNGGLGGLGGLGGSSTLPGVGALGGSLGLYGTIEAIMRYLFPDYFNGGTTNGGAGDPDSPDFVGPPAPEGSSTADDDSSNGTWDWLTEFLRKLRLNLGMD